MPLWSKSVNGLLNREDNSDVKKGLKEAEDKKETEPEEAARLEEKWTMEFYHRHICRIKWPTDLNEAFASMSNKSLAVYTSM